MRISVPPPQDEMQKYYGLSDEERALSRSIRRSRGPVDVLEAELRETEQSAADTEQSD